MLSYKVHAKRIDGRGSLATTKDTEITLDTGVQGRRDAFNPAELLLASLAACMIKNIERVSPLIHFAFRELSIELTGRRRDSPPKMERIEYSIFIDTDESDNSIELLHRNIQKFGTVYNTLAEGCALVGAVHRMSSRNGAIRQEGTL